MSEDNHEHGTTPKSPRKRFVALPDRLTRTPRERVLLFTLALAAVGSMLFMLIPEPGAVAGRPWLAPVWALVIGFAITESLALHVEIRKESHSLSLSCIPLMIGLLYASPVMLALAYIIGGVFAILVVRRSGALKAVWNAALFVVQCSIAVLIVQSTIGSSFPDDAVEWMAPLAAVLAAELISLAAVPLVIMTVDVKFRPSLFGTLGQSQVLAAIAGVYAVAVLAAASVDPRMLLYGALPVTGVGLLLRRYGSLAQKYRDVQQLQRFTKALANERGTRTTETGLVELVEILRARGSGLLVHTHDDEPATLRMLVEDIPTERHPERIADLMARLVSPGNVTRLTRADDRHEARALLDLLEANELAAYPVLGEIGRSGVLFVTDRLGVAHHFTDEEIGLFRSLADTFSGRLSNDYLVAQLATQAQHDALTGLANRLTFETSLASSLSMPESSGLVAMIDLDRFKEVNDSLGHETGDHLLIEVGRRLRSCARSNDLVARLGGDEYAILMLPRSSDTEEDTNNRLIGLQAALAKQIELDGLTFDIGASIGVAEWPLHGSDNDVLLRRADAAMYHAKRNQLGIVRFSSELDFDSGRQLDLSLSVRAALDRDELSIHFQPRISLVDGTVSGVEALARWTHPIHGPVPPDEFIPLLTRSGLTGRLTRYVLRRAADLASALDAAGTPIPVAVNLTPRDLLDASLPDDTRRLLADIGLPANLLMFEITEDAMVVDFETSAAVLDRIRALGVRVSIDDFGTGYSSLQYIQQLPVDEIKIDRSFIFQMSKDRSAHAIVETALTLATRLGLSTVAEGVEDDETVLALRELGCSEMQGFLISPALSRADFMEWISGWNPTMGPYRELATPVSVAAGI